MKFRDLSLLVIVVFVVVGVQLLARVNRPPPMPSDMHHQVVSQQVREQCLRCHQPAALMAAKHPPRWRDARVDCLLCHTTTKAQNWRHP
jgi:nitrate reductase cytochrome c-type subunit